MPGPIATNPCKCPNTNPVEVPSMSDEFRKPITSIGESAHRHAESSIDDFSTQPPNKLEDLHSRMEAFQEAMEAMDEAKPPYQDTRPSPRCVDGLKPRATCGGVSMRKCP